MIEIIFGIVSGIITSLGCGGGTVLIFLLTYIYEIEQHIAQGINLIFFIPTCIISILVNIKKKNINKKICILISLSGVTGAVVGAEISKKINISRLKVIYGFFLLLIAIFEIYSFSKLYRNSKKANNKKEIKKEINKNGGIV